MKIPRLLLILVVAAPLHSAQAGASTVLAWGMNNYGQTNVPPDLTNAISIYAGADYCLALRDNGQVTAWGRNDNGETNAPPGLDDAVALTAYLALRADGTVVGWGAYANAVPPKLSGVVEVVNGLGTISRKFDGTLLFWQYHDGSIYNPPSGLSNVVQLASGADQWLALRSDGTVVAWPTDANGGSMPDVPNGLTNIVSISAGTTHNLALTSTGKVIAWGTAFSTTNGLCNVPADLTSAVAIAAGDVSLALKPDGSIVSWGGYMTTNYPPPQVSGVTSISAGEGLLAMGLMNGASGKPIIHFVSPQSRNVGTGSEAFFSVSASGAPPLHYQWYLYGTNAIAGATNRWLDFPHANPSQSGQYSMVITNAQGSVVSPPVSLYVVPSLDIAAVPAININGQIGATYQIEYVEKTGSTNSWTPLVTVTLTNSPQYYCDLSVIGQPARFYRVVQVP